jgi:hypothetical protein
MMRRLKSCSNESLRSVGDTANALIKQPVLDFRVPVEPPNRTMGETTRLLPTWRPTGRNPNGERAIDKRRRKQFGNRLSVAGGNHGIQSVQVVGGMGYAIS